MAETWSSPPIAFDKATLVLPFVHGHLRPLKVDDVFPGYVDGLNDPEVNRYLVTVRDRTQTLESVRAFVAAQFLAPDAILFGIWLQGQSEHCGTLRLHGIGRDGGAHIGICLFDRATWGRGIGSAAIATVAQWAFGSLGLHLIEAGAYAENVASWKSFLKAGFVVSEDIPNKFARDGQPVIVRRMVCMCPNNRENAGHPFDSEAALPIGRAAK